MHYAAVIQTVHHLKKHGFVQYNLLHLIHVSILICFTMSINMELLIRIKTINFVLDYLIMEILLAKFLVLTQMSLQIFKISRKIQIYKWLQHSSNLTICKDVYNILWSTWRMINCKFHKLDHHFIHRHSIYLSHKA